jgi:predicted DNA-binding protein (MmcQ/YjbR family)
MGALIGWLKLYRDLLNKAVWKLPDAQRIVLFTVLMLASHCENSWIWKGKKFTVRPGQFITSIDSLSKTARVSPQSVRTALLNFEKLDFLTNESTSTGRLVTVINWDLYQSHDDESTNESTDDQQGSHKALTTIKKIKNVTIKETVIPFGEIMESWNSNRGSMPRIREIDAKRQRAVKFLWNKNPSLEWFEDLFKTAASSDFLSGRVADNHFMATFEFVLKNDLKILEGSYANRGTRPGYHPSKQNWCNNEL